MGGAVERDEPPGARASYRRSDEQPTQPRQPEGDDREVISVESEIWLLRAFYGAAIAAVQREVSRHERTATTKALRQRLKAAIFALTERRRQGITTRHAAVRRLQEADRWFSLKYS